MKTKALNLILRVLTLGSKFLLSIYIVKYLGLELNGEYGIFVSTITLLTYVLGLDFYSYSTREILQNSIQESGDKLRNQFVLFFFFYLIVLPAISFIWLFDFIDPIYMVLFYVLLVMEHLSTELYRVLVMLSKPIMANLNLFLRSGIWIIFLLVGWLLGVESTQNLKTVYIFWLAGSVLSIVISLISINSAKIKTNRNTSIDWKWIRKGVVIAFPFFIGTISYKVIQFADRYLVDYFLGATETGTYIFFSNISMLIETFVQTTVVMIFSPKLVAAFNEGRQVFDIQYKVFKKELTIYSLIAAIGVIILIYPLLAFVDKAPLMDNIEVFFVMVLTRVVFNLSLLYHFYLYVSKKDKVIMNATLIAVVIDLLLNLLLIPSLGMIGSAFATLAGFSTILVLKLVYSKKNGL